MTKEEYVNSKKSYDLIYKNNLSELARNYAYGNNTHSIGDIITDHIGSVKIIKIGFRRESYANEFPECIYVGRELKKDKTPTKKEAFRDVYQHNLTQ